MSQARQARFLPNLISLSYRQIPRILLPFLPSPFPLLGYDCFIRHVSSVIQYCDDMVTVTFVKGFGIRSRWSGSRIDDGRGSRVEGRGKREPGLLGRYKVLSLLWSLVSGLSFLIRDLDGNGYKR